jgi:spore germination cell wall hydrolase CwlJ-like protein
MSIALPFEPLRPWRTHPSETIALVSLGIAASLALAGASGATPVLPDFLDRSKPVAEVAPAPPPMEVRDLAPEAALAVNAGIPMAGGPVTPAAPFVFGKASAQARSRALDCLTSAIYYEAGQESPDGQRAVAQVVLNRVRHPAFPNSVCGVVYEGSTRVTGCQFTFTCDNSMALRPVPAIWNRVKKIAAEMLAGRVYAPVGYATHYHANYVVPYWASSLAKASVEGAHIFYRWAGGWGRPPAFSQRWSGREADPTDLRQAALAAPHNVVPVEEPTAIAQLEAGGAVVTEDSGRVMIHFTPEAREAVERVKLTPYVERVTASDNLRYALGGGELDQPALGAAPAEPAPAAEQKPAE